MGLSLKLRERHGQGSDAVVEQLRNEMCLKDLEISRLKVSDYAISTRIRDIALTVLRECAPTQDLEILL